MTPQVLLIEDDDAMRMSLAQTMDLEGITVISANGLAQARRAIRANFAGVILSDIRMPVSDGFAVLAYVQSVDPDLPVVMLTGEADVPMALRAMKDGAYDFLEKPCPSDQLLSVLERAIRYRDVVLQKRRLEYKVTRNDPAAMNFPGTTNASKTLQNNLRKLGAETGHIYIAGATGVGKKLAAFTLHMLGQEDAQFVGFNLNNPDAKLADVVVPKGAVNLSVKSAHLASDDDLDWMAAQIVSNPEIRLLVSGQSTLKQNASNHNMFDLHGFVELTVPSLQARRKDLPIIFEQTLRQLVRSQSMDMPEVSQDIYARILTKEWDGNLTQLRAFAQNFLDQLFDGKSEEENLSLAQQLDNYEELILSEGLRRAKGSATRAAQQLEMPRKTFYDRLARYDIKPKDFK
jgi:two-component system C4-dicarboxylate transport response regulator DctD